MNDKIITREDMLAAARSQITLIDAARAEQMITDKALVLDVRELSLIHI